MKKGQDHQKAIRLSKGQVLFCWLAFAVLLGVIFATGLLVGA